MKIWPVPLHWDNRMLLIGWILPLTKEDPFAPKNAFPQAAPWMHIRTSTSPMNPMSASIPELKRGRRMQVYGT